MSLLSSDQRLYGRLVGWLVGCWLVSSIAVTMSYALDVVCTRMFLDADKLQVL